MNAYQARRLPLLLAMVIMCLNASLASVAQVEAAKTFFHEPVESFAPGISDYAISHNMKMLATCGPNNNNVMLWNFETGRSIFELHGDIVGFTKIVFSDNDLILAAGDGWGRVWLWDIPTQKLIHRFDNPDLADDPDPASGQYAVLGLDFGAGNRLLALQIWDSLVVWDVETGERAHVLNDVFSSVTGRDVVFLPDGNRVAVIETYGIKIIDLNEGRITMSFPWDGGAVSGDGKRAYTAEGLRSPDYFYINTWNIDTGELIHKSEPIPHAVVLEGGNTVAVSRDGRFVALSYRANRSILKTPGVDSALRIFDGNVTGGLRRFKFSADMNYLAATGGLGDGHVYVYDISDLTTGVPNATLHENE